MSVSKLLGALSPQEVIKKINEIIDNMGNSSFSGSYNDLTDKPTIPAAYSLPAASATVLGGVKVGSGLMVTDGVLASDLGDLPSFRNKLINGNFTINQRVVSGTVTLAAGVYGHDRWKAGASGCTYTFATVNNVTTITISAGSLIQIIEGINLQSGTYILSWVGTVQGKIGAGSYGASGVTNTVTGGTNLTVEFGTGTLSNAQLEFGSVSTKFEDRLITVEQSLCERYFEKSWDTTKASGVGQVTCENESGAHMQGLQRPFRTIKRAIPTMTWYSPSNGKANKVALDGDVDASVSSVTDPSTRSTGTVVLTTSVTHNTSAYAHFSADAEL